MKAIHTVDDYINEFPAEIQVLLSKVRETIKAVVPKETEETIGYGIPTYKLNGNLVHFGGFKSHVGFYPAPRGLEAFKKELEEYDGAKGSVQFPFNRPIPYELIARITAFRVKENLEKKK